VIFSWGYLGGFLPIYVARVRHPCAALRAAPHGKSVAKEPRPRGGRAARGGRCTAGRHVGPHVPREICRTCVPRALETRAHCPNPKNLLSRHALPLLSSHSPILPRYTQAAEIPRDARFIQHTPPWRSRPPLPTSLLPPPSSIFVLCHLPLHPFFVPFLRSIPCRSLRTSPTLTLPNPPHSARHSVQQPPRRAPAHRADHQGRRRAPHPPQGRAPLPLTNLNRGSPPHRTKVPKLSYNGNRWFQALSGV
jgi:hypothetical protein